MFENEYLRGAVLYQFIQCLFKNSQSAYRVIIYLQNYISCGIIRGLLLLKWNS